MKLIAVLALICTSSYAQEKFAISPKLHKAIYRPVVKLEGPVRDGRPSIGQDITKAYVTVRITPEECIDGHIGHSIAKEVTKDEVKDEYKVRLTVTAIAADRGLRDVTFCIHDNSKFISVPIGPAQERYNLLLETPEISWHN